MTERAKIKGLYSHNQELKKITVESTMEALIQLMRVERYEDISITAICERAGISRNAFYKNFGTKENVFKEIVEKFIKHLLKELGNPFNSRVSLSWYQNFFKLIKEESEILLTLMKASLKDVYLETVNDILIRNENLDAETKYKRIMWNGAIQNIVAVWVESGMKESIEVMAKICFDKLKYVSNKEFQLPIFFKKKNLE